ncbi:hypothetical protein SAMD00019534_050190 [Acytostelium subglobosum LB1]|uniref:hypothetical protein n=1 Tax=Acytostelium subglobosum LB1 TaxID=1410327 RepID=UPI0006449857|nr:hypothetical protein SAMD00019534_050190 [Acytostelium subglobosum LB1]GAM21844.1 hypothetical protein SAMD00019534_050190 [Acytostelium subglobosum LB1]|eukprot:XP_012754944.1 hypothetical protein SAMD00019534_050190 [Acytostelium subglobosum LB1]
MNINTTTTTTSTTTSSISDDNNNNNDNIDNNNEQEQGQEQEQKEFDTNMIKHPLQHRWSLWFDHRSQKTSQDDWADALKKIISFDTVEDFWCVFNNLPPISTIKQGSSFHLFKEDIEPKWEHEANKRGGKWSIATRDRTAMDNQWLQTVMACIGETFDYSDEVCGVVFSSRKAGDKITLWTKHGQDEKAAKDIGSYGNKCLYEL